MNIDKSKEKYEKAFRTYLGTGHRQIRSDRNSQEYKVIEEIMLLKKL